MNQIDDGILDNHLIGAKSNRRALNPDSAKTTTSTGIGPKSNVSAIPANTGKARVKKIKRMPWNTDVLKDRFTPLPYQIQIIDSCVSFNTPTPAPNTLILIKNTEIKNYLNTMLVKQFSLKLTKERKLILLVTNMGSEVSKYVDIMSRHTSLKLAGIDSSTSDTNHIKLKSEAQLIITSISILHDWLKKDYLNANELLLVIFDEVHNAVHNETYSKLVQTYFKNDLPSLIAIDTVNILPTANSNQLREHIEHLKSVFKCSHVEAGTDLLDTHNIFNGNEPTEVIQVCDGVNLSDDDQFQMKVVDLIKEAYGFLKSLEASGESTESLSYIHSLCVRVLNECIYLLNEVGVWCLAKSLLPFICQLDKLSLCIENSNRKRKIEEQIVNNDEKIVELNDAGIEEELVLQYTSTHLRNMREICVKHFLASKSNPESNSSSTHHSTHHKQKHLHNQNHSSAQIIDQFVGNFTAPKVRSLIQLLRQFATKEDFCGLLFVHNKQVAMSLR